MITEKEGEYLIRIARKAIENYIDKKKFTLEKIPKALFEKRGIFVTLRQEKKLRGCIGFPYPDKELWKGCVSAAISAAFSDPRFEPLAREELKKTKIEVSVLTEPELIDGGPLEYPNKIEIGKHGLIIKNGFYSGLLLPSVPVEWKWDKKEFLSQTCRKAGISPEKWKEKGTEVYKFEAKTYSE